MVAYLIPVSFIDSAGNKFVRSVSDDLITKLSEFFQKVNFLSSMDNITKSQFGIELTNRNAQIAAFRVAGSDGQPIEDALFRVLRFVEVNFEEKKPDAFKVLVTEGEIIRDGQDVTVDFA